VLRETETQPESLIFQIGGYDYDSLDLYENSKEYHGVLRNNMKFSKKSN